MAVLTQSSLHFGSNQLGVLIIDQSFDCDDLMTHILRPQVPVRFDVVLGLNLVDFVLYNYAQLGRMYLLQ